MPRTLLFLVFTLLLSRPASATFTTFNASGSLTRLNETTYHLRIGGYLWGDHPLLSPSYPIAAYTVNSEYALSGPFGTPFNPAGGMVYDLDQGYAHASYATWRLAGMNWFDLDFEIPDAANMSRLFMNFAITADIWHFVVNSPYDQYWPVGRLDGSGMVFADLPTTIGSSSPVLETPEPPIITLLLAACAIVSLRLRRDVTISRF